MPVDGMDDVKYMVVTPDGKETEIGEIKEFETVSDGSEPDIDINGIEVEEFKAEGHLDINTDRWKIDGNCALCRRMDYCKKPCTAQKRRKKAILSQFIRERTGINRIEKMLEGRNGKL